MPRPISHQSTVGQHAPRLRAIGAILAVIALAPALAACNDTATSATATAIRPVQVQRVVFAHANENREFAGVVRARYDTDLGFRAAGNMLARLVTRGEHPRT